MTRQPGADKPAVPLTYARPMSPPPGPVVWDPVAKFAVFVVVVVCVVFLILSMVTLRLWY
jgi:hypothetical protein